MRKTIFTALVTLLVMLAVVSCDNALGADKSEYTADGMVTLSINTGGSAVASTNNSRSLTSANSRSKAGWVEVIFKSTTTTEYFRGEGSFSENLTLKVPVKVDLAYDAIILIGRNDGTLLATGKTTTGTITTATTVSFNVTPLKSNISAATVPADPGPPSVAAVPPDFKIDATSVWASTVPTRADQKFENGPGSVQPCFLAPYNSGTSIIKASLTVNGFTDTGDSIKVTATPISVKFIPLGSASTINPNITRPTTGNAIAPTASTDPTLEFTFTTTTAGQYMITVDIPVRGFDQTKSDFREWHIRGGITPPDQAELDFTGTDTKNAIALLVTDEDPNTIIITVGNPTWPSP